MDMYTLLYSKRITNNSTGNSAQCYVAAWGGDGSLGENGCMCIYG